LGFGVGGVFLGRQQTTCEAVALAPLASAGFTPRPTRNALTFRAVQQEMESSIMSMFIGEALVGEGNEIAHIDLLIGNKDGPVGNAFANALARQSEGHSNLLAVLTPNLAAKPSTVLITKVTIKGKKQAVQMFGPAQAAVAKAVADSVADGVIPQKDAEDLVIVCGVFIHWEAADDKKIYDYNYQATKDAIANAMKGKPSIKEVLEGKDTAAHPFRGF
jgi:5,6,7,8-tetrahydromethanopterin hydro-lyase